MNDGIETLLETLRCPSCRSALFSAPIENRYTRQDVQNWLARASLEAQSVGENFGWIATGRKAL